MFGGRLRTCMTDALTVYVTFYGPLRRRPSGGDITADTLMEKAWARLDGGRQQRVHHDGLLLTRNERSKS